jgi:hypothetical protein
MTNKPAATSVEEISKWIGDAAVAESNRSGRYPGGTQMSEAEKESDLHVERIESSLFRARTKTYVRMLKPFRRMFRNQGAVNDSLIEAVHHLAAQNEELMDQLSELRGTVRALRSQLSATPASREKSSDEDA